MSHLSRDSWSGQRKHHTLGIQRVHGVVDRLVECVSISKGVMGEMMRLEVVPHELDVVQFGAYLGSHSTVSQCARAASAARESLLVWIGPLSSTKTTGLAG